MNSPPIERSRLAQHIGVVALGMAALAAHAQTRVLVNPGDQIEGDRVRVDGWLVQLDRPGGWRWRSSLTREDSGGGACEVVYVCSVSRL